MEKKQSKKETEKKCFDTTRKYIQQHATNKERKYFYSVVPIEQIVKQRERPDFVIDTAECSYLIEHFMVDFCYDGPRNNQSQSKRASRGLQEIYEKYHDDQEGIKDSEMDDAVVDIENAINDLTNLTQSFVYEDFVKAFKRTFDEHYDRVSDYKRECDAKSQNMKIGFLIELHYIPALMHATYNGSIFFSNKKNREFPLTQDIVEIIKAAKDLDFVIISQYDEGVPLDSKDVKIYEPKNLAHSLKVQGVKVFDGIIYLNRKSNIKIELV